MKKLSLLCYALFTSIALQCSEQAKQLELIKKIDYKKIETQLQNDYITYLGKQLEVYKTTDFTPQQMCNVCNMSTFMTGTWHFPYNAVRDEQGNSFIRVAVQKMDLPCVDWFITKHRMHCITREDFDFCVNACATALAKNDEAKKNIAYEILKIITKKQGANNYYIFDLNNKNSRENLIKQLILLQIRQKKNKSTFVIEQELMKEYIAYGADDKSPIVLADLYQTVTNKKGNTLSHIIVNLQNADELCQCINNNYVSPAKNKADKTILDLALHHFQTFTQDPSLFDIHPDKVAQARCCLFMLLRYIKAKQTGTLAAEYTCCDKHIITI